MLLSRRTIMCAAVSAVLAYSGASWATGSDSETAPAPRAPAPISVEALRDSATAAAMLTTAEDAGRVVDELPSVPGYDRECGPGRGCVFGTRWTDDHDGQGGRDGCDGRSNVLAAQLSDVTFKAGSNSCSVGSGTLHSPYTSQVVPAGSIPISEIDIDHVVPLARSWALGAAGWPIQQRIDFAADQEFNLLAVESSANASKSDSGLGEWMPPDPTRHCWYAARYLTVSNKYDLSITAADADAARTACDLTDEQQE